MLRQKRSGIFRSFFSIHRCQIYPKNWRPTTSITLARLTTKMPQNTPQKLHLFYLLFIKRALLCDKLAQMFDQNSIILAPKQTSLASPALYCASFLLNLNFDPSSFSLVASAAAAHSLTRSFTQTSPPSSTTRGKLPSIIIIIGLAVPWKKEREREERKVLIEMQRKRVNIAANYVVIIWGNPFQICLYFL